MRTLDNQPLSLQTDVFNRLFSEAEIACLNKENLKEYEDILKAYLDIKIPIETAKEENLQKDMQKDL